MSKYDQQQKEQIIKRLVFDNPWWATRYNIFNILIFKILQQHKSR